MSMTDRVAALVDKVGQTVTYHQLTGESFDVATGVNTPTYSSHSVTASIRDFSAREIIGNIRQGDRKATIAGAALSFIPGKDDRMVVNGKTFSVISVETRNILNDSGVHVLQIRGLA